MGHCISHQEGPPILGVLNNWIWQWVVLYNHVCAPSNTVINYDIHKLGIYCAFACCALNFFFFSFFGWGEGVSRYGKRSCSSWKCWNKMNKSRLCPHWESWRHIYNNWIVQKITKFSLHLSSYVLIAKWPIARPARLSAQFVSIKS